MPNLFLKSELQNVSGLDIRVKNGLENCGGFISKNQTVT